MLDYDDLIEKAQDLLGQAVSRPGCSTSSMAASTTSWSTRPRTPTRASGSRAVADRRVLRRRGRQRGRAHRVRRRRRKAVDLQLPGRRPRCPEECPRPTCGRASTRRRAPGSRSRSTPPTAPSPPCWTWSTRCSPMPAAADGVAFDGADSSSTARCGAHGHGGLVELWPPVDDDEARGARCLARPGRGRAPRGPPQRLAAAYRGHLSLNSPATMPSCWLRAARRSGRRHHDPGAQAEPTWCNALVRELRAATSPSPASTAWT